MGMLQLKSELVDPLQLLRWVVDDMAPVISNHGQSLTLELSSSLPSVWADEGRLRQVVLNLLSNASKFTPRGGKITLRARELDSTLVVEIQDTGPGIAEADQRRLFEPYHRLESDREQLSGLGLGLALCKTLVQLHGGRIWVKSRAGEGSTFGFSVPLKGDEQQSERPEKVEK
jgi:signal transduction histidine kinase